MKKIAFISLVSVSIFLTGCNKSPTTDTEACSLTETTGNACTSAESGTQNPNITAIDTAKAILLSLKNKDMQTLATFVGPQGVRFSPYAYVNTGTDIILSSGEIENGPTINRSYTWGVFDGSGKPIDLGIGQYFEKFVYDIDFLNAPEVNENKEIMRGNSINNVFDVYQNSKGDYQSPEFYIIEFYIPGIDPKYDGIDWRSLTLVLQKTDGKRYLIGVVHNQWTI